jgi:hypothetical protein
MQPFFDFTLELSKTKDATTHHVFQIYNKLFEHLEQSMSQLRQKKVPWKKKMLQALQAAQAKLSDYCSRTDTLRGDLYAIGTMLHQRINSSSFLLMTGMTNGATDIERASKSVYLHTRSVLRLNMIYLSLKHL